MRIFTTDPLFAWNRLEDFLSLAVVNQVNVALAASPSHFLQAEIGMQTIRYRAGLIGAEISVGNRPEGGLAVVCRVPADRPVIPSVDDTVRESALEIVS